MTNVASDEYLFKAPSLRNVGLMPPYFHSGAVWELDRAVQVMGVAQLGADLNDAESLAIAAFLKSLTGKQPEVVYPILPPHTAETPLPDVAVARDGL